MPVKSRTEFAASSLDSHADITRTKNKTRNSTNQRLFYLCQMRQILITGATGNIGTEVIRSLTILGTNNQIIAGVRNILKAKQLFFDFKNLDYRDFDFENPQTFDKSLDNIDCVFLLRPPHISDVDKYFKPLIQKISEKGIRQIIFLSVQGAEKSKIIPHNKIERLIRDSGLDFIFLRPK